MEKQSYKDSETEVSEDQEVKMEKGWSDIQREGQRKCEEGVSQTQQEVRGQGGEKERWGETWKGRDKQGSLV